MYNDTIKVANKIITDTDLDRIFQKMNADIIDNNKICKQEELQNERYEREYQHWTAKDFNGTFKCNINFYDDTNISFDNYNNFYAIFNSRIHEIKSMWVRYHYSYTIQNGKECNYINQNINMDIYENRMNIDVNLSSDDKKMDEVYQLIKEIVLTAPDKYDRIIKKKNWITNKVTFALGIIPSLVICSLLVFVSQIREIYVMTSVIYPIAVIIFGYIIGGTVFGGKIERLYSSIIPDKKYAGYDAKNNRSIYTDDIDSFTASSEIIIGKNTDNLTCREEIKDLEERYSKFLPIELIALLVLSFVIVFIGKLI